MANKELKIRPYARLLTMLGDQLIKNETIALTELVKNSYDADADWVKVSFIDFDENFKITSKSRIIIEDNGSGMTENIIENSWMNPATANKLSQDGEIKRSLIKKRIVQGEKGIGRFAMLKLGKTIRLISRPNEENIEYELLYDLSSFDDDFQTENGEKKEKLYLDSFNFVLNSRTPIYFVDREIKINHKTFAGNQNNSGTYLEISNLKGSWSEKKIDRIARDLAQFGSVSDSFTGESNIKDLFEIGVFLRNQQIYNIDAQQDEFYNIIDNSSVLKITDGIYDSQNHIFNYKMNGTSYSLSADSSEIRGLTIFRNHFNISEDKKKPEFRAISNFGDFNFSFYIFDLVADKSSKYCISEEKYRNLIKDRRVYLVRDGIRVLPYGDPDDDWLQIDIDRGTIRAGEFFSNDQIIGKIEITKAGNPHLKDKTNREGLIEDEDFTVDFIAVIRSFLSYHRAHSYKSYLLSKRDKEKVDLLKKKVVEKEIESLKEHFKDNPKAINLVKQLEKVYSVEKKYLENRALRTESLAAVGLSVETSSHDIMMMLNKCIDSLNILIHECMVGNPTNDYLQNELQKLNGMMTFVQSQMKDIQLLFVSSKQRRRQLRVSDFLDKVLKIYTRNLTQSNIKYIPEYIGSPLVAKCTDAVLLQMFINLFDNSIYWLNTTAIKDKTIKITLDGDLGQLIFSDNGPGIREEDKTYIFEAFYSGKGEDGKGLGLYITRQLLERNDYTIELADRNVDKILSGANFVINFLTQE